MTQLSAEDMRTALEDRLATLEPVSLVIEDDSARHAGHAAMKGISGGMTHIKITISSHRFAGQNPVATHRMVNAAIKDLFEKGLHAVQIDAKAA